jgi:hypothetical protein
VRALKQQAAIRAKMTPIDAGTTRIFFLAVFSMKSKA